jgi:Txe/YoeB family toxin of Txe-Axe toxin-antitoxin module
MKEAYYFSHDANARQDEKVLMLRAEHGWEGYGIFWALVEMMFESSDSTLHLNKIRGIAVSYNIPITVLESVINTCITEDLFVSDGEKFWSDSLIRRKTKYMEIKEKKSEAGRKGMAKRWGKDNTDITDDNSVITKNNKGKESKVKESKGKEIKEKKKKEKPSSPKQVYDEDSSHYQLALRLFKNILNNNPDYKEPNLQNWANDVRLMMEQDKRTEEQISYLVDWVQNDSFWKTNILSVSKLREKFDQLVMRVKENINKQNKTVEKQLPKAYQSLQDWADGE